MEERFSVVAIKKKRIFTELDEFAFEKDIDQLRQKFSKYLSTDQEILDSLIKILSYNDESNSDEAWELL